MTRPMYTLSTNIINDMPKQKNTATLSSGTITGSFTWLQTRPTWDEMSSLVPCIASIWKQTQKQAHPMKWISENQPSFLLGSRYVCFASRSRKKEAEKMNLVSCSSWIFERSSFMLRGSESGWGKNGLGDASLVIPWYFFFQEQNTDHVSWYYYVRA